MKTGTAFLFFLGTALAQTTDRHDVPLKNWAAPKYWQPSETEAEASRVRAELRTPSPEAATPAGSLVFVAMTPCRVVDTRASQMFPSPFGAPSLSPAQVRSFPMQLSTLCSIPSNAMAYSFNVTLVPPPPPNNSVGYLTMWPAGQPQPNAVTVDDITGDIRNNAAIVPAGTPNGSVSAITNATTDLVIDINGYYAPSTGVTLAQGNAIAPSLSFSGDAGTGIFSSGTGTLNLATGGTNRLTVRSDGDLDLAGNVRKGGTLFLHNLGTGTLGVGLGALAANTGFYNTASGHQALLNNSSGSYNSAAGMAALNSNTTGSYNTANGASALGSNNGGNYNTASGLSALGANTMGSQNTAIGANALIHNTADNNTATGYQALQGNTTGIENTASGVNALQNNSTGASNTANGYQALNNNSTGSDNTATGRNALFSNTGGSINTASGSFALYGNTTGAFNTAIGFQALTNVTTGNSNIALGYHAGSSIITGSNNIDIGTIGGNGDNGVTRIGAAQTAFFAVGIRGVTTGNQDAMPVMIDSAGQLGTTSSSRRYKEDIQDMAEASRGLLQLRPVTFRYQKPYADGSKPIDYGLIAEEVASIYPDLVVKGPDGQVETVQYQKLTPMLLNELQKLQTRVLQLEKILETISPASH